jgi:hypothetical protein
MLPGTADSGQQGSKFWVMVLLDRNNQFHSIHCCLDSGDRVRDKIFKEGFTRRIFVVADSVQDALKQAFEKGILEAL